MLTDSLISNAVAGAKKAKLTDGDGLYVEVMPSGRKTFRLRYRQDGQQRDLRLGEFGPLSLADARFRRDLARRVAAEGRDPGEEPLVVGRPSERRSPGRPPKHREPVAAAETPASRRIETPPEERPDSWANLAREYLEYRNRAGLHYRTRRKLERQVQNTVDVLGHTPVGEITAADILATVKPFEDRGKIESAHEIRSRCVQIMDFAEARGFENRNPATKVGKAMIPRRRGFLPGIIEPKRVGKLMRDIRAFENCEPQTRWGLLLSAYLFPRSDQLRGATWDEIDLESAIWEIPGERMKGAKAPDHLVPLPRQVIALLEEIGEYTRDETYVLASPRGGTMLSDPCFNIALRKMGYCTQTVHCHHGFRTTASTNLNEMGFNRDWIERQMAHVDANAVRAGYNKAQYIRGRTEMMQTYADWLDEMERTA